MLYLWTFRYQFLNCEKCNRVGLHSYFYFKPYFILFWNFHFTGILVRMSDFPFFSPIIVFIWSRFRIRPHIFGSAFVRMFLSGVLTNDVDDHQFGLLKEVVIEGAFSETQFMSSYVCCLFRPIGSTKIYINLVYCVQSLCDWMTIENLMLYFWERTVCEALVASTI